MAKNNAAWLYDLEREALMALAALHEEFGPDSAFTSDAIALVVGRSCVAELGFLHARSLLDLTPDRGYVLTGEGYEVLPASLERASLREHREEADESLRGEM